MAEHEDLGPPAVELRELDEPVAGDLLHRIRTGIHRRLFVSETADFALRVFCATLFDYLDLFMRSLFDRDRPTSEEKER